MSPKTNIDSLDPKHHIIIKGSKVNNLKNLSVALPRNQLIVVTGVSGSGKSSLVFDTLFAEGQRMYVESLSAYARQFLARMEKPQVEYIKGISPAIAIEQKTNTKNPRSTVGTSTEIYDYLKLLFARVGKTISPISGKVVKKDSVSDVVDHIHRFKEGSMVLILAPLKIKENRTVQEELKILLQKGFSRVAFNEGNKGSIGNSNIYFIEDILENEKWKIGNGKWKTQPFFIVIDRNVVNKNDEDNKFRIADSVQTAFFEGEGNCVIEVLQNPKSKIKYQTPGIQNLESGTRNPASKTFSDKFELDGILFEEPTTNLFSFNNPYGACSRCGGFGKTLGIDENLVIPDKSLSVYEGAIAPWRSEKMSAWLELFINNNVKFDFPIHRPWYELTEKEKKLLWTGNEYFKGLNVFFKYIEAKKHKIQYRVMLSRYRSKTTCPDCKGTRLRKDASYIKIGGKSLIDLVLLPLTNVLDFFDSLKLNKHENNIARRLHTEIKYRLNYLNNVGLGYLTLNRLSSTLSGGESQRIKLATILGSALVGSIYILDEPTIGLHPKDTKKLIGIIESLRNLRNTVIVVEHDELVMKAADRIIDIGPEAGSNGGNLVFEGTYNELINKDNTYTAKYLSGKYKIEIPEIRRKWKDHIAIIGASENNLKNINLKIPLGVICIITGVSGSGKSTLVKEILKICKKYEEESTNEETSRNSSFGSMPGRRVVPCNLSVEFIDQNPIGKSSRSNPVTYVKAYNLIRELYADQSLAKARGYKPAHFSFNVDSGRCDTCQGQGTVTIEMQFLADINLTCESCKGKRFKQEILDVRYCGSGSGSGSSSSDFPISNSYFSISEVLEMTIDDAIIFFKEKPKIIDALRPLQKVGLGYVRLGQPSNTLSGGEAQRVKLASFLGKGSSYSPPEKEKRGIGETERRKMKSRSFGRGMQFTDSPIHRFTHSVRNSGGGDFRGAAGVLFIFDEPTTGLHTHDIKKLLTSINALVEKGHSVVIIEHNMEVIKCADWIIDLGPEGGENGGKVCFAGLPEDLIKLKNNHTARYLRDKFRT